MTRRKKPRTADNTPKNQDAKELARAVRRQIREARGRIETGNLEPLADIPRWRRKADLVADLGGWPGALAINADIEGLVDAARAAVELLETRSDKLRDEHLHRFAKLADAIRRGDIASIPSELIEAIPAIRPLASETAAKPEARPGRSGRKALPEAEQRKRLDLIRRWERAKAVGITRAKFCADKGESIRDLEKAQNWARKSKPDSEKSE